MARPRKCRKVCHMPENPGFDPIRFREGVEPVILNVDEYEALRLIDREGLSQEQCGEYMAVARTTVQQIYTSARQKLADALFEGAPIRIQGGDYELCRDEEDFCRCGGCWRQRLARAKRAIKEAVVMKIAIPLDENQTDICPTFGRAPYFLFSEDGLSTVVENPAAQVQGGAGLKAAQFLVDHEITVLITPRCGQNAADVFKTVGMKIYKSQGTSAAENVAAYGRSELAELTHFHAGYHGIR